MKNPEIIKHILPWVDPNRTITPTAIVLHWWEEPISRGDIELLEELWEERSLASHFAVLADGTIYQLTPHANSFGRHAKCANNSAIGIEIQGMGREDLDENAIQFQSVVALTRFLKREFSIQTEFKVEGLEQDETMRFFGVTSHKIVDHYCSNANGKQDVHDEYLARVIEDLEVA
jgi:N-acetyl-anhydromuramyl-L-alanine amidase AmpD